MNNILTQDEANEMKTGICNRIDQLIGKPAAAILFFTSKLEESEDFISITSTYGKTGDFMNVVANGLMNLSKEEEETYKIFRSAMLAVNISNIQELLNKAKAKAEQNNSQADTTHTTK
jgi:hypothetical protein